MLDVRKGSEYAYIPAKFPRFFEIFPDLSNDLPVSGF